MDARSGFVARPDERCQRGLLVRYFVTGAFDEERLACALQRAWSEALVEGSERWGARTVRRLVRQFRFEVRLGERDGEISLLHRTMASPAQRADHTLVFETCLRAELAAARSSS